MPDLFSLSSYRYDLPPGLIAQVPVSPRDMSRLMIVDRRSGAIRDAIFRDLADLLEPGDSLVLNDTKVIPARLFGKRDTGGRCEVFLLKPLGEDRWHALARPGRKLRPGTRVTFSETFWCEILETHDNGSKIVRLVYPGDDFMKVLHQHGHIPLPGYISREDQEFDVARYQTVFAAQPGAVAAPTAGLHFTPELLANLAAKGVDRTAVTLHVGVETFQPVRTEDVRDHRMHSERFSVTAQAAERLNGRNPAYKQVAVGTTCCRTLESAAANGPISAGEYETNIFIYPGYQFRYVQHLLTNFHLPESTLLMLVSAFAGYELMREAYSKAIERHYRFYSYGDAMLIL